MVSAVQNLAELALLILPARTETKLRMQANNVKKKAKM